MNLNSRTILLVFLILALFNTSTAFSFQLKKGINVSDIEESVNGKIRLKLVTDPEMADSLVECMKITQDSGEYDAKETLRYLRYYVHGKDLVQSIEPSQ